MQVFVVKFIGLIPGSLESSETVPPEVLVQIQVRQDLYSRTLSC